jgi:hypothetical protein
MTDKNSDGRKKKIGLSWSILAVFLHYFSEICEKSDSVAAAMCQNTDACDAVKTAESDLYFVQ